MKLPQILHSINMIVCQKSILSVEAFFLLLAAGKKAKVTEVESFPIKLSEFTNKLTLQ